MTATLDSTVRERLSSTTLAWLDRLDAVQLIGGVRRVGTAAPIDLIDPGTGLVIVSVAAAGGADVDDAVRAAHTAFQDGRWSERDADEREAILRRLADLVDQHDATLVELESLDTGKPLSQAAGDIREVSAVLRYYAGWANKLDGAVIAAPRRFFAATIREPVGVCGAITPWNYPLPILAYKLAPALAFGNTFVAKPSELASLSTIFLCDLISEAGIPDGVVNIVVGAAETGEALSRHPELDKLAFTGSTRTGQAIARSAAEALTKVTLELGGKSAHIVFADSDLDAAATSVLEGIWTNAGQVCVAGSRLLVQDSIHDEFVAVLAERTTMLTVAHGLTPGADIGPLIAREQQQKVNAILDDAAERGAYLHRGADVADNGGFFLSPTIVTGVAETDTVATDELFAPVLTALPFTNESDAVRIANSSPYGLAAGVWSSDVGKIHRVARRLRAGSVWANTYGVFHPTLPFGGVKGSGYGRELGASALGQYTETKTLVLDTGVGS